MRSKPSSISVLLRLASFLIFAKRSTKRMPIAKPKPSTPSKEIGPAGIRELIRCLQDKDWYLRLGAATYLGQLKGRGKIAIQPLIRLLADSERQVREAAHQALYHIGRKTPQVAEALRSTLQDKSPQRRAHAARLLGELHPKNKQVITALQTNLKDKSPIVRANTAFALGLLNRSAHSAQPALRRLLRDKQWFVRQRATEALSQISPRDPASLRSFCKSESKIPIPWSAPRRCAPSFAIEKRPTRPFPPCEKPSKTRIGSCVLSPSKSSLASNPLPPKHSSNKPNKTNTPPSATRSNTHAETSSKEQNFSKKMKDSSNLQQQRDESAFSVGFTRRQNNKDSQGGKVPMMKRIFFFLLSVSLTAGVACTNADTKGIAAECTADKDCKEDEQKCLTQFRGGYCGEEGCTKDDDCVTGAVCVKHTDGKNYCFRECVPTNPNAMSIAPPPTKPIAAPISKKLKAAKLAKFVSLPRAELLSPSPNPPPRSPNRRGKLPRFICRQTSAKALASKDSALYSWTGVRYCKRVFQRRESSLPPLERTISLFLASKHF